MGPTSTDTGERRLLLRRGRRAVVALLTVNAATLLVAAAFSLSPYPDVGRHIVLWIGGVQLFFGLIWFLPAFLFHLLFRRRGFAESSARALWSFVEALGSASP